MTATYPQAPGWKTDTTETSREAAVTAKPMVIMLRDKCEAALRGAAMTADEVAELLRESVLSVRPRVSELVALGKVEATDQRRKNTSGRSAVVWRAAARGRQMEMDL